MKIEIKLADPKYCDGCPGCEVSYGLNVYCVFGYFGRTPEEKRNPRPAQCIEENGE